MIRSIVLVLLLSTIGCDQPPKHADVLSRDGYVLPLPKQWRTENFSFPISFAPSISYTGTERACFPEKWGDRDSQEYWSYDFFWRLDGNVPMDTAVLTQDLKMYFEGLVGDNIRRRSIPADKFVPTAASLTSVKAGPGDVAMYEGDVNTLDYMALVPMTLHCRIHVKADGPPDRTLLLFTLSPQPVNSPIWAVFDSVNQGIICKK